MSWTHYAVILMAIFLTYTYFQDDRLDTVKGKRVLVTGASEGIGKHLALQYAKLGANVVVTARRLEKLNQVVDECQSLSPDPKQKHFAVSADMSIMNDTKKVVEFVMEHLGGLDILVLNHIIKLKLEPFQAKEEQLKIIDLVMDINFRSYVHLMSHSLTELSANGGSIIVLNSLAGKMPMPFLASYSTSKHALNGFFQTLRSQFQVQKRNVSVTSCTLGLIKTDTVMQTIKENEKVLSYMQLFPPASIEQTALDIIKGGARRVGEIYTPYFTTRLLTISHALFPTMAEYFNRLSLDAEDYASAA